jgi:hypothetical protein
MCLSNSAIAPSIAGLAVGIGFVVMLSIFFTPPLMNSGGSNSPLPVEEVEEVNFGVALPERDIVVKRGETVRVPVTIETLGSVEIVLGLSVMPYTSDIEAPDASELALFLDKESIVLSKDNISQGKARIGDNITIGYGWVITDAGFLTITASPTAPIGTYEYVVEANYANTMGSGQLITVTVTD